MKEFLQIGATQCDCGACTPHICEPRESGVYRCDNADAGNPLAPHDCDPSCYRCGESWHSQECRHCGYGHCAGHGRPGVEVELRRRADGRWSVRGAPAPFYSKNAAVKWATAAHHHY